MPQQPIPDKVKQCLGELSASQQVALRGYIGTLRAEIKDLEEKIQTADDPDPHAHYHGHEKCTADHGHDKAEHDEGHEHGHGHDDGHAHGHDHKKGHETCDHPSHDHGHQHKKEHGHDHKEHEHDEHKHGHDHEHKHDHHEHKHGHEEEGKSATADDVPAWKKQALDQTAGDPMSLNWNTDKMEE